MRVNTKERKKARRNLEQAYGRQEIVDRMYQIYQTGKQGFDVLVKELGVMLAETIRACQEFS